MLTLTQEAANAVEQIISQPEVPEGAVLRFEAGEDRGNGSGPRRELHVELVDSPDPQDVLAEDVAISVEPKTVGYLDDKVIDAEIDGNQVEFKLYSRPDAELS
jgi:Fe-S cluster assembly iron-binding protein IscA